MALVWLRGAGEAAPWLVLWLFAVVWATDVGAFAAGRLIGGPRLAPRVSPKKTWAGAAGGLAAALAVSAAAAALGLAGPGALADPTVVILLGAALGIAAQAGDLLESAIKRRFGVKDVSHIIPGHGGAMDRVDGILVAAPVAAGLVWLAARGAAP